MERYRTFESPSSDITVPDEEQFLDVFHHQSGGKSDAAL